MIGKTIKTLLTGDVTLVSLVGTNIFPYVMNEGISLPSVVYTIESLTPSYNKSEWANDEIIFAVHSFSKDYAQLQLVVVAVREALELKNGGYGTQDINRIYLSGQQEGYDIAADTFFNKLIFSVKINSY
jgi:hypothetical protein